MNNKKILIINNGLAGGGIERASVSLANHFDQLGYHISVLALYQSEQFFTLNPSIQFIEPTFSRAQMNQYAYVINMILFARRQIKQIKPHAILAFGEWTNPYVVIAASGLKIPLFLTDRMNPLAKLPFTSERLRKMLYKRAKGIIAQTAFAKEILIDKTKSKNIAVIHNPVNAIDRLQCEVKNRIVTVGRLAPEKGHHFLIKAFAQLDQPQWELSIVGDGIERSKLEQLTIELGIADRVIFHGHLKDFRQQLSEAQIFVLPSLKEGFPNALLEAMSVPLACITTNFFQGKNEIIDHGSNGLVVKPSCAEDLTVAIDFLISSPNLRDKLAKNAIKVREDYNFDKIAKQYLDFILK